ncbi:MAG: hypothetical protein R3B97_04820 [Dehalococcoidia bacterium]|nr:hypothetical protein [Dehalococcoidia bacterium]MCB9486507.1 hypothetical protein [Thermoflexaceae bacterium]
MHAKLLAIVSMVALFLVPLAACGGDDDGGGEVSPPGGATTSAAATTAASSSGGGGGATSELGYVDVDGARIAITQVQRCKPFSGRDEDLDLTGIGSQVQVFVNINRLISNSPAVGHELSIQGNAVGGAFTASANSVDGTNWFDEDAQPIPAAPFSVTPERVSGAMVVADARGSGTTHEVAFDIAIPGEIKEC